MHEGVGKDFLEKLAFERELRGLREFEQRLIFGDSKGRGEAICPESGSKKVGEI